MLSYRNALPDDLPVIIDIYNSTVPSRMVTADTETVSVESRIPWFEAHKPATRPLWVVEEQDVVIGWVSFQDFYGRPAYDATAEISIYLHPSQRGKGLGKQVLQHAIGSSPALGIRHLVGFIFAHNTPSLQLFAHAGFEQWGVLKNVAVLEGVERSLVVVGRRVMIEN